MRWLFIIVLGLLVAVILSITLMQNDSRQLGGDNLLQGAPGSPRQPSDSPLLPAPTPQRTP
jgi:hypothetical protein